MKLIGLYSSAPQSGKTTVSAELERLGYVRVPFADTLKQMVIVLLIDLGYAKEEAEFYVYHHKQFVLPSLGVSVRHLLQTLGTEWGRQCVRDDVWLRVWTAKVQHLTHVVVDDVRFPNEAELIRRLGGEVWHLRRAEAERAQALRVGHASEGSLDAWPHFTRYIANDGTIDQLLDAVTALPLWEDGAHP